MAPSKHVTTFLVLLFAFEIPRVVVGQHQPYFFNYQPQQQQPQYQTNTYQPYTNAPPETYYTPTFESHTSGGGHSAQGPSLLGNFFGNGFSPAPTAQASSPLVPYPTQVTTLDGARHHLSPQPYQPVGNSIVQQTPTVPTTTTTNAFRPSPFINHHIVNGLPRQQFFGNNYAFFRERHGLTLPATTGPFLQQNTLQNAAAPTAAAPSPTPAALVSSSPASPSASPNKVSESKPNPAVKTLALDLPSSPSPPTTQSTFLSRFPFNGPSTFSPATYQQQQSYKPVAPATTAAPRTLPTTKPTTAYISGVSPSFQFSQFFPETDPVNSNELVRQPLFQGDDEEEEEDDNYSLNNNNGNSNNNNNYYSDQARQVTQPQQRPQQQFVSSPPVTASPVSSFKTPQQTLFNSGGNLNSNALSSQAKDEPAPIRVHNTQPIRIVFNYEQAVQALEENPGARVVIAHTEKSNLTDDEFSTTARPLYVPAPSPVAFSPTSPRSESSPSSYQPQSTTPRTSDYYGTFRPPPPPPSSTYRPAVTTTPRPPPQRAPPTTRFQYQPVSVPYNTQTTLNEGGTTAAALENLALELEGRFGSTGRPSYVPQRQVYETVATLATEPTTTESPVTAYKRGGKKYLVIPSSGDKVYRAPEPRVVVNDLANILVQTVQPGGHYSATPPSTFPRQTFREYEQPTVAEVGQQVDEDLSEEIAHLSQQIQQDFPTTTTTPPPTTTTATFRPPIRSSPQPRIRPTVTPRLLRITTYRPPFTFPSTFRTTTNPPPPPPPPTTTPAPVVLEIEETLPEVNNQLSSEPPSSLTPRRQPQSPRYYYNDRSHNGLSGAHQRYEYNGVDEPSSASPQQQDDGSQQQRAPKGSRRRPRPRGRLIAGSPPRPVQVNGGPLHGPLGPVLGPNGLPPQLYGPGIPLGAGPGGPFGTIPQGAPLPGPGPVFRVGPKGRLLRRKSRPRAQLVGQQPSLAPSVSPSISPSFAPSPSSPSILPPFSPIPQDIGLGGPFSTQLPPLYSPTPFVPQQEVPLVTTFRPGPPPNALVQQRLVDEDEERKLERPGNFRSRFRVNTPSKPTASTSTSVEDDDDEGASNQYESEEEAPVPQRRRFSSTTTSTTEQPVQKAAVVSDRANILQRQIRFNRNRKNQNQRNTK